MTINELARPEIRALQSYKVAASPDGAIRLNANEAPLAIGNGAAQELNRYPALRPTALTANMAGYYGVTAENVLVTRGSSEGIDLLIRTFCRAGQDSVLLTPPVFALYEVYASVQGARTIEVPLRADRDFALDAPALLSVIVDEAYVEYSCTDSLAPLVSSFDNLVVLRTLSKALALAGARCGAVVAPAALIRLLDGVLAPYAVSSPVIRSVELALSDSQLTEAQTLVAKIVAERERLRAELAACKAAQHIWPSEANFLLVRFRDLPAVERRLAKAGIAIRTYGDDASLRDCARITVASASDNDRLVQAIRSLG
jgi:histidinol-phosphate aminotransferase